MCLLAILFYDNLAFGIDNVHVIVTFKCFRTRG